MIGSGKNIRYYTYKRLDKDLIITTKKSNFITRTQDFLTNKLFLHFKIFLIYNSNLYFP